MNHSDPRIVLDHAHLHRFTGSGRADEHGDGWIVGLEGSPVVSNSVNHVFVVDAVLAGCRLNVHLDSLRRTAQIVNIC